MKKLNLIIMQENIFKCKHSFSSFVKGLSHTSWSYDMLRVGTSFKSPLVKQDATS